MTVRTPHPQPLVYNVLRSTTRSLRDLLSRSSLTLTDLDTIAFELAST